MKRHVGGAIIGLLLLSIMLPSSVNANSTTTSSSSSTSTTSSSSSSSNASRASTTSRQSSLNASRQAMQRAQQNATRQNAVRSQSMRQTGQRTQHKGRSTSAKQSSSSYHPIAPVKAAYRDGLSPVAQYQITSYYNNFLFFQIVSAHNYEYAQQKEKIMALDVQKRILQRQMKTGEKLYTVTVKLDNQQQRLIVLPKEDYDKIQQGQKVRYHNGRVEIVSKVDS